MRCVAARPRRRRAAAAQRHAPPPRGAPQQQLHFQTQARTQCPAPQESRGSTPCRTRLTGARASGQPRPLHPLELRTGCGFVCQECRPPALLLRPASETWNIVFVPGPPHKSWRPEQGPGKGPSTHPPCTTPPRSPGNAPPICPAGCGGRALRRRARPNESAACASDAPRASMRTRTPLELLMPMLASQTQALVWARAVPVRGVTRPTSLW